jgi:hypothetical protein
MSGAEPWIGSYRPLLLASSEAEGSMPIDPGEHRGLVRQDVAEHVAGDHHVELLRVAHSCIAALSTACARARRPGTPCAISIGDVAPELGGLEHVHLVDRAQALAALARRRNAACEDAADLASV